jgi:hypothetical protein
MQCETVPLDFWPPEEEAGCVEVEGLNKSTRSSPHTIHMWKVTKKVT